MEQLPEFTSEYRVRAHTTYSVTRYIQGQGSDPIGRDLTLTRANELAIQYGTSLLAGASVGQARITQLRHDERVFPLYDLPPHLTEVMNDLLRRPRGASVEFRIEGDGLLTVWLTPEPHTGAELQQTLMALRALPYDLAAAMRKNARETGDVLTLKLLDEAKVAVDA